MKRTEYLTDINKVIRELENDISDHDWEGNTAYADDLRKVLDGYYKLRDQGELYVPEF